MENEFKKAGCAIYDRVIRKVDDGQPMIQVCLYLDTLLTNLTVVSNLSKFNSSELTTRRD